MSAINIPNNIPKSFSTKWKVDKTAANMFMFAIGLSALDAYNLGPVPITWIGTVICACSFAISSHAPGKFLKPFWVFMIWAAIVTGVSFFMNLGYYRMPPNTTLPLTAFVLVRLIKPLAFIAVVSWVYSLMRNGADVVAIIIKLGVMIALASIYIYLAQTIGLPELPRNRMSTSGGQQEAVYSYAFHRATGTFLEPSRCGTWLVLPFMLSLNRMKSIGDIAKIACIGSVVLLTGSLNVIVAIIVGYSFNAAYFSSMRMGRRMIILMQFILIMSVLMFVFQLLVVGENDLISVLSERLAPILDLGLSASNRKAVYEYILLHPPPIFGYGFGLANLEYSDNIGSDMVVSYLSLYVNIVYSTGYLGLFIIAIGLLNPIYYFNSIRKRIRLDPTINSVCAAYIAWLIILFFRSEELEPMLGVVVGMFIYYLQEPSLKSNPVKMDQGGSSRLQPTVPFNSQATSEEASRSL